MNLICYIKKYYYTCGFHHNKNDNLIKIIREKYKKIKIENNMYYKYFNVSFLFYFYISILEKFPIHMNINNSRYKHLRDSIEHHIHYNQIDINLSKMYKITCDCTEFYSSGPAPFKSGRVGCYNILIKINDYSFINDDTYIKFDDLSELLKFIEKLTTIG